MKQHESVCAISCPPAVEPEDLYVFLYAVIVLFFQQQQRRRRRHLDERAEQQQQLLRGTTIFHFQNCALAALIATPQDGVMITRTTVTRTVRHPDGRVEVRVRAELQNQNKKNKKNRG
jgi:hypothetical protein